MKKILINILVASALFACASKDKPVNNIVNNTPTVEEVMVVEDGDVKMVGGWAPVFFSNYDKPQLLDIANKMKDGVVKKVVVSYPKKMQPLAKKIQNYLQNTTSQKVTMDSLELKDTEQVSYNMTQVIVTLYF